MSTVTGRVIYAVAVVLVTMVANAERLSRDPFRPPAEFNDAPARPDALTSRQAFKPEIRGILVAGGQSLVNLGGEIIGPGEETNGYLLLEVGEEHAVFQRGDEVVTLALYPDKDDESN